MFHWKKSLICEKGQVLALLTFVFCGFCLVVVVGFFVGVFF
jgi:hypothetical protein